MLPGGVKKVGRNSAQSGVFPDFSTRRGGEFVRTLQD
jgi:DNA-binding sugar fermentation-stimulating protein